MSFLPHKKVKKSYPDYSEILNDLKTIFDTGKTKDLAWRYKQLHAIEKMMNECEKELFSCLKSDLNKSELESFTMETSYISHSAAYNRKNLKKWSKIRRVFTPMIGQPGKSWIQPEPLGVVLIIGTWNYPLQLTLSVMSAAIAAGNCVVIKPSELAPKTSEIISKLIPKYLDSECVKVVEGAAEETSALLDLKFDHILYTGGCNVGKIVMRAASKNLTPVTLELGGKSPCIVMPDANLNITARRIAWGKFTNAGQTCIAPDYILTDAKTESKLVPLIAKNIKEMFGKNPQESESYGRIINDKHFKRVSSLIQSEHIAVGGEIEENTRYIAPTLLTNVSLDSPIMQDEIFGPLLPIIRINHLDDAIQIIRQGEKPLSAYIFTNNKKSENKFLDSISSGNVCINDVMMFMAVDDLPFGGVGSSGMGVYGGRSGFETFSHMKSVMKRRWWPDIAFRYAPHSKKKIKFIKKIR
tara:strand:- start:3711 stop:5117 length:1407 start_codon:yes stop_codon:yes gene_type:complete